MKNNFMKILSKLLLTTTLLFLADINYAQMMNCGMSVPTLDSSCSIPNVSEAQLNYSLNKFCSSNTKMACMECKKLINVMGACDLAKCIYEQIGRKQGVKYDITYKDGKKDCLADSLYKSLDLNAHVLQAQAVAPLPLVCGDGILAGDEVCDDGNASNGDGCCGNCKNPEPGYECPNEGQPCVQQGPMPPNTIWNCME